MRVLRRTAALTALLVTLGLVPALPSASAARTSAALQFQLWRTWEVPGSLRSGFGVSREGQVYFYDRVSRRIHHYGTNGRQLRTWTVQGSPHGLALMTDGRVVVMEQGLVGSDRDRVRLFSAHGGLLGQFEIEDDFEQAPIAVATAPDGTLYVASESEVVRYSSAGTKLHTWPDTGAFSTLSSLAVAPDGQVYVTDEYEHRVKRFSATGALLAEWGRSGTGRGQFGGPTSVAVDPQGRVYVADPGQHTASRRVQVFDPGGRFVGQIGGPDSDLFEGTPEAVRVDGQGRVFVYDDGHHWGTRIRSFRPRPPQQARTRIVSGQARLQGRRTTVRLRCTAGAGQCRGTLLLQHRKQDLAKRHYRLRAGQTKAFQVRVTKRGARVLGRQRPKRIRVVAQQRGATKVTRMVRRR